VVRLRGLVIAALDPTLPRGAAKATLRMQDGRTFEAAVTHAKGSTEAPLSDAEIEAKVRDLARFAGFRGAIDDVIAAAWEIDTLPRIDRLANAAAER
jgi:2-methylcitrate dehydratase PrpD